MVVSSFAKYDAGEKGAIQERALLQQSPVSRVYSLRGEPNE
jgi:hypothetical protein